VHFIACAVAYAAITYRHLDWIAVISGPLTLVGVLFLELRSIADVPALREERYSAPESAVVRPPLDSMDACFPLRRMLSLRRPVVRR
jgi:hypothetical protein